ncbi:MAG: ABC transporter substrate-binding protein [Chloroflexia bacterium]|nr:ABC transporter substrate-binding protein [Chloroflexia bacterium]
MAFYTPRERHVADLHQALRTESIDRRTFLKVAGAAAVASGLSQQAATPTLASPRRAARAQADASVFVYGSGQDISNLDPHTGHDYSITWGQRAVYDSLLRYQGNPAELQPLLATEVVGSPDATTWTIKLAANATFHDGSSVTAEAVQFNFQRMLRKNLGAAWLFATVMDQDSVQVVDPTTLEINLLQPFAPYDAVLPWLFVANPALVQEHEVDGDEGEAWLRENEAGGGPFTIARWEIGNVYEFTPFPDYWFSEDGAAPLDGFVWRIIRESSTKRIAMETGEITYGDTFTPEDIEALAADSRFVANMAPSLTPFAIKLNNQAGPTADINVRKALSHAFDYDAAIESVSGRGTIMEGPLATALEPWHKKDLPVLRHDMEAAKAALAASEFADGFAMDYVYVTGLTAEELFGLILLEKAAELGITVNMVPLVWPDMVARASTPETAPHAMAVYSGTDYVDPDNFLWQAYHSSQAGFWAAASHYMNPALDKLLEDARADTDQDNRKALYDEAQLMLVNDAVEIWVYTEIENDVWLAELGEPYDPIMGGDIRAIGFSASE